MSALLHPAFDALHERVANLAAELADKPGGSLAAELRDQLQRAMETAASLDAMISRGDQ